jgi:hypothetical protein
LVEAKANRLRFPVKISAYPARYCGKLAANGLQNAPLR